MLSLTHNALNPITSLRFGRQATSEEFHQINTLLESKSFSQSDFSEIEFSESPIQVTFRDDGLIDRKDPSPPNNMDPNLTFIKVPGIKLSDIQAGPRNCFQTMSALLFSPSRFFNLLGSDGKTIKTLLEKAPDNQQTMQVTLVSQFGTKKDAQKYFGKVTHRNDILSGFDYSAFHNECYRYGGTKNIVIDKLTISVPKAKALLRSSVFGRAMKASFQFFKMAVGAG